jgi:hypothetical protein
MLGYSILSTTKIPFVSTLKIKKKKKKSLKEGDRSISSILEAWFTRLVTMIVINGYFFYLFHLKIYFIKKIKLKITRFGNYILNKSSKFCMKSLEVTSLTSYIRLKYIMVPLNVGTVVNTMD